MKILCETTGAFELVDYSDGGRVIQGFRPTVATSTTFLSGRAASGQVRILANLQDEATDEEFETYVNDSDGDIELAVGAFIQSYGIEQVPAKKDYTDATTPKRTRKTRETKE